MAGFDGLLLVLVALYLIECILVAPAAAVLLPMRRRSVSPELLENPGPSLAGRRLAFGDPLPPLSGSFVLTPLTFAVSPEGIEVGSDGDPPRVVPFAAAGESAGSDIGDRGSRVTLSGAVIWTGVSDRAAAELAGWLRRLAGLSREERADEIRERLRQQLDVNAGRARLAAARSAARRLLWLCHAVLVTLFLGLPLLIATGWFIRAWIGFAVILVLLITVTLVELRRQYRRLHGPESLAPPLPLLETALVPPGVPRAWDLLMRHLLLGLDPLAAARLVVDEESFEHLARRRAWDLGLQGPGPAAGEPDSVRDWYRREQGLAMARFLDQEGYPLDRLFGAPQRTRPSDQGYCPRCHALFTREEGTCSDCPEVALEPCAAS